jgi:polyphosphate kinase 2
MSRIQTAEGPQRFGEGTPVLIIAETNLQNPPRRDPRRVISFGPTVKRLGRSRAHSRLGDPTPGVYADGMSGDDHHGEDAYDRDLRALQIALVRHQAWAIGAGAKALIIFEGRDGAGKDGTIARITQHLAPRSTRVISLPKPSDRERSQWFFQRYVEHLPACGEIVVFNRSWYNRGGVDPVMGFCTPTEHEDFLRDVPAFERMLEEAGITLVKIWLDISKAEQARRLLARREDPLKQLKTSPLDTIAQKKWKAYSAARDQMLERTHTPIAPWVCVRGDHKKAARLNVIRHILRRLATTQAGADTPAPDPEVLFTFETAALTDGRLAR